MSQSAYSHLLSPGRIGAMELRNRIVVMAARPGRIHADLAVDAPYPRDEAFRMSEAYNEYCRRTSGALHAAMEASAP